VQLRPAANNRVSTSHTRAVRKPAPGAQPAYPLRRSSGLKRTCRMGRSVCSLEHCTEIRQPLVFGDPAQGGFSAARRIGWMSGHQDLIHDLGELLIGSL